MTTFTGESITFYRLATLKSMLKLESKGMRNSGGALRPRLAVEFGLRPRAPYVDFIAAIESRIKELS